MYEGHPATLGQSSLKKGGAGCMCTMNLINTKSNTVQGLEIPSVLAMPMSEGFPDHAEMLNSPLAFQLDEDILLKQVAINTLFSARHVAPLLSYCVTLPA